MSKSLTLSLPYSSIWTYDPPSSPVFYTKGLNRSRGESLGKDHPKEKEKDKDWERERASKSKSTSQSPSTIPRASMTSDPIKTKTPSAKAKVLPWVQGVHDSEGSIPDGMFGPYNSRPASMVEQPTTAPRHPFAYTPASRPSLPFAAIANNSNTGAGHQAQSSKGQRPESEAFSRGAGMRDLSGGHVLGGVRVRGDETPAGESGTSPGEGTFGMEGKPGQRTPPPLSKSPLPPTTKPPSPDSPSNTRQAQEQEHHLHKPHHPYPFSPAEALAKQRSAMADARAAALAQLEAAQHNADELLEGQMREVLSMDITQDGGGGGGGEGGQKEKGPRQTFDTTTSVPSFGHIHHQNGMPISTRPSLQTAPDGFFPPFSHAQAQGHTSAPPDVFRIPFGVPTGTHVPRPLMVLRDSSGGAGGLGLGGLGGLAALAGGGGQRRGDERSAYVETVPDVSLLFKEEEVLSPEHTLRTDGRTEGSRSRAVSPAAARTESHLLPSHSQHPTERLLPTQATRAPSSPLVPSPKPASQVPSMATKTTVRGSKTSRAAAKEEKKAAKAASKAGTGRPLAGPGTSDYTQIPPDSYVSTFPGGMLPRNQLQSTHGTSLSMPPPPHSLQVPGSNQTSGNGGGSGTVYTETGVGSVPVPGSGAPPPTFAGTQYTSMAVPNVSQMEAHEHPLVAMSAWGPGPGGLQAQITGQGQGQQAGGYAPSLQPQGTGYAQSQSQGMPSQAAASQQQVQGGFAPSQAPPAPLQSQATGYAQSQVPPQGTTVYSQAPPASLAPQATGYAPSQAHPQGTTVYSQAPPASLHPQGTGYAQSQVPPLGTVYSQAPPTTIHPQATGGLQTQAPSTHALTQAPGGTVYTQDPSTIFPQGLGLDRLAAAFHGQVPMNFGQAIAPGQAYNAVEENHEVQVNHSPLESGQIDESLLSPTLSQPSSLPSTTLSNVKRLIDSSRYHDETLCQLLDAARLNLIGGEAKKALQRAARARVVELKELRERGEEEDRGGETPGFGNGHSHSHLHTFVATEYDESRESRGKERSKEKRRRRSKSRKGRTASGKSDKARTTVAVEEKEEGAPAWAQDIMARLTAFDQRFTALEGQKPTDQPLPLSSRREAYSQFSREVPSGLIDDLIYNGLPSSGPTGGGVDNSQGFPQSAAVAVGSAPTQSQAPPTMDGIGVGVPPGVAQSQRAASGVPSHYSHMPIPNVSAGITPGQHQPSQYAPTQAAPFQYAPTTHQNAPTLAPTQISRQHHPGAGGAMGGPRNASGDLLWGSEVELPKMGTTPKKGFNEGPTINILAPTESGPGTMARTVSGKSIETERLRNGGGMDAVTNDEAVSEHTLPTAALPDPREKDLPPQPAESEQSQPPGSTPDDALTNAQRSVSGTHLASHAPTTTVAGTVPRQMSPPGVGSQYASSWQPDQWPPRLKTKTAGTQPSQARGSPSQYTQHPQSSHIVQGSPSQLRQQAQTSKSVRGSPPPPVPTQASNLTQVGMLDPNMPMWSGHETALGTGTVAGRQGTMYHTAIQTPSSVRPPTAFPTQTSNPTTFPANSTAQPPLLETMTSLQAASNILSNDSPPPSRRDILRITDPLASGPSGGWRPWDLLTQRLYSWALIMEEKSFVRALEDISLGRQVGEFPLSVFMMLAYKRWVRKTLSENPAAPCDKLFVPPNLAIAINAAVHGRQYREAKEILLDLWDCVGQKEPPRIIVALAPLGDEVDEWAAHRYDLSNKHLTSYRVSHLSEIKTDGRSFWWWEVIRQAWPQSNVPTMEELESRGGQRIINEHRAPEYKHENSLYAANISRNLLLGHRPERTHDLTKQREVIWAEMKRLLGKKRNGRLIVDPDAPEHLYDT
ncbi:hypothetical protein L198_01254 [Cryptococcus wingfieldii CBS 7118]|uniref:Uncharacterized protein n=1 Tax=Cryptococcus wingfieldii CBS 7118 TaxID=1295528 RepID=A0A1E3JZ12_9TREE|nr:hypothetical protein L198_01254 [Cryptococcus wingfieldii CBS 7118]ODO06026.1 hypothetical protein L198_01254 [Cryptococcus wingfieldii CBS 7118]